MEAKYFRVASIGYMDQLEILIVERAHHERELLIKERDVKERRENEKRVNEREMRKQERMVNEVTTLDASLDSTLSRQQGKCRSPGDDTDVEGAQISKVTSDVDNVVVGASHDKGKLTDVHHSNNEIFENVFAHEIQYREQSDSINDTYVVKKNNSNIISNTLDMDPNRGTVQHDNVDSEQNRALNASLIKFTI
ncbi:hypothetical protein Tco_0672858 [Tanacetum coccineum]